MPKPIESPLGKMLPVPAGLHGKCNRGHRSVTDGTEGEARLAKATFWAGRKGQRPTGFGAFVLPCPMKGCGIPTQYRTDIRVG